jgi:predicted esterase
MPQELVVDRQARPPGPRPSEQPVGPANPPGDRPRITGMPTLDPARLRPATARARPARTPSPAPTLRFPVLPRDREWDIRGVVLLLHGGQATSVEPVRPGNLAAFRMARFVPAFRPRPGRESPRVAVALLRNRMRGWNAEDAVAQDRVPDRMRGWNAEDAPARDRVPDPVADALWALERIDRRLGPVPVVLAGHSMGGRTALRVAGHPSVCAVAALAPWLPPDEPVAQLAGRDVLIAHGTRDRVTSLDASRSYARDASVVARSIDLREFPGGHAMLRGPRGWHRLVYRFALGSLDV